MKSFIVIYTCQEEEERGSLVNFQIGPVCENKLHWTGELSMKAFIDKLLLFVLNKQ